VGKVFLAMMLFMTVVMTVGMNNQLNSETANLNAVKENILFRYSGLG
jgi:hypothetical protein